MKKLNLYITAMICLALSVSCESDQKVVDEVLETFTSGAVLRTRPGTDLAEYDMFRTQNGYTIIVEQQDETNGALIDRVDFTIDYVDANPQNGDVAATGVPYPALALTAADFTINERGLPEATFSGTMQEALDVLGIDLTDVLPGDAIQINLELFFTDGRSFKASDAAVTVTGGSFFSSPFLYRTVIDDGIAFDYEVTTSDELDLSEGAVNEDYEASISIDDEEEGALLETLNIYRTFRDLTIGEDGIDLSEEEALFDTYAIADLDLVDGARVLDISYTVDELLGDTVTLGDLLVGDDIQLRYEIVTADGRIVTTEEGGTEYFFSIITSECVALDADGAFPGEYTVDMTDSYGDGWNGGFLSVFLGGVEVEGSPFRIETGGAATGTFTVPEGTTDELTAVYTTADWDDENSFFILDPNGQKAAVEGPFPNTNGEGPFEYPVSIKVCE
jgi:hypothetical protein